MFTFKLRRGTAAMWTAANRVLEDGEPGYETDTKRLKVGDGSTPWKLLPYFNDGAALTSEELNDITSQVLQELELQDLTLLWENAKA